MRFDASMESLINIGRSESFADLNNSDFGLTRSFISQANHRDLFMGSQGKNVFFTNLWSLCRCVRFVGFDF